MNPEQTPEASTEHSPFSKSDWEKVTIEVQQALAVAGSPGRASLEVTVHNQSEHDLQPQRAQGVAFSFHLLDGDGQQIAFECVRTPLRDTVPAGASRRQDMQVIVPAAHLETTAAIRVSMLQLREYWIDQINPEHAGIVAISRGADLTPAQKVLAEAAQLWPSGRGNTLKWPYSTMMVAEQHHLLYIPVAKCACTSLKSMMVELAGVEHFERAIKLGVHQVTDRFNTGAQLKDKPMERAREILASDQYEKFAVVREPFERLVSAYLEKFVHNRANARNLLHTRSIISAVQGSDEPNLQRGISFDEFVDHILKHDCWDLDPHWRPQHLYMRGVPHISKIFRLEDLDRLEVYLVEQVGAEITLAHENRTDKSAELLVDACARDAAELEAAGAISPESFRSSRHYEAIAAYFSEDFHLYRAAQP